MDALKKAEQEKREAARRLEEAREKAQIGQNEPAPDPEITGEIETPPPQSPPRELELEPRPGLSVDPLPSASTTGPHERPQAAPDITTELAVEPSAVVDALTPPQSAAGAKTPLEFVESIGPEAMADFDQTFHGVALNQPAPGMFDETLPGAPIEQAEAQRNYDETLPGVPAAQLARDIGTDQPTPAAAQTVFTAGHARQPDLFYKWGLPAAGVVLLIAASVYVYFSTTPVTPNTPSPWVARGIEAVPPPAEVPMLSEPVPQADAVPATVPDTAVATEAPAVEVTAAATVAETPAPVTEPVAQAAPVAESQPVVAAVPRAAPAVAAPAQPPSMIRVGRSQAVSEQARMLREALALYRAGEYEAAAIHYLAVLNEQPQAMDALLGMGAIAMAQGDAARAVEYFARVLRLDPQNETANAALIGLQRGADPVASESAVKTLLQASPENPFLHFTLGNIYALQQRWAEAQQAFFDAYRFDSANPDYALNLAASLDRLGQAQPALDYYTVALRLAEGRSARFDAASVQARVQALSAAQGGDS